MKNKKGVAVLLTMVLMLVGAFSVTSFAYSKPGKFNVKNVSSDAITVYYSSDGVSDQKTLEVGVGETNTIGANGARVLHSITSKNPFDVSVGSYVFNSSKAADGSYEIVCPDSIDINDAEITITNHSVHNSYSFKPLATEKYDYAYTCELDGFSIRFKSDKVVAKEDGEAHGIDISLAEYKPTKTAKYTDISSSCSVEYSPAGENSWVEEEPTKLGDYDAKVTVDLGNNQYASFVWEDVVTIEHSHAWKITAVEGYSKKTLECKKHDEEGCDRKGTYSVSIEAQDGYAGAYDEVVPDCSAEIFYLLDDTKYRKKGEPADAGVTDIPEEAGHYWARVAIKDEKGKAVSAVADDFTLYKATVETIDNQTITYGDDKDLVETSWGPSDVDAPIGYTITYTVFDENEKQVDNVCLSDNTGVPTSKGLDAGSYAVQYEVTDPDGEVVDVDVVEDIEIQPFQIAVTADDQSKYINEKDPEFTFVVESYDEKAKATFGNLKDEAEKAISLDRSSDNEDVGVYRINECYCSDDNFVVADFVYGLLTIKASRSYYDIPVGMTYDYTGTEHDLIAVAEQTDGTGFVYAVGDEEPEAEAFKSDIPSEINAGDYTVWYKVAKNGKAISAAKSVTAKIIQAEVTVVAEGYNGTYDNERHGISVEVEGLLGDDKADIRYSNKSFEDGRKGVANPLDERVSLLNVGSLDVFYKVNLSDNYVVSEEDSVLGKETITITKANPLRRHRGTPKIASDTVYSGEAYDLFSRPARRTDLATELEVVLEYGMKVADSEDSIVWSSNLPTATEAKTYEVYYRVNCGDNSNPNFESYGNNEELAPIGSVTIKPASLTVTADDQTIEYGKDLPLLTYTVDGKPEGGVDLSEIIINTTYTKGDKAGTYIIDVDQKAGANPNYNIKFVDGVLTVTAPAPSGGGAAVDDVQKVVDMLKALDPNAADYAAKAQEAIDAYNKLTDAQKADDRFKEQTVATKLVDAQEAVKSEEQKAADKKAADEVSALINKLPADPVDANYDDALAAYNAYMALTDAQKALLDNATQTKIAEYGYYYGSQYAASQTVKLKSVKAKKGRKAVAKWSKNADVSGYQLYYKAKGTKAKKVTISKASTVKKTVKKLKAGKKYSFKVRTYTKVYNPAEGVYERVYGQWSKVKKAKAKK